MNLLIVPLIIPFMATVLLMMSPRGTSQLRWIAPLSGFLLLIVGFALVIRTSEEGPLTLQVGSWASPGGIGLICDTLSALMLWVTGVVALAVGLYRLAGQEEHRPLEGALEQGVILGVNGAFLTADLFNLYVWFEVLLVGSFGIQALGQSQRAVGGAIKYTVLSLVGSVLFLIGAALLYAQLGTLNLYHVAQLLDGIERSQQLQPALALLVFAFLLKAAAFPLMFWLPASYPHLPASIAALFAGLLSKVGVYALLRIRTLWFPSVEGWMQDILIVIAVLTMLATVVCAAGQAGMRRILSFHISSQIGFMLLGIALPSPLGLSGTVFYLVHHIVVKAALFLCAGVAERLTGQRSVYRQGGLYRSHAALAMLFLFFAFSLAGFPPFSGFFAKLLVLSPTLNAGFGLAFSAALLAGLLTTISMVKIWNESFWKRPPEHEGTRLIPQRVSAGEYTALLLLVALTLFIGLAPEPLLETASIAVAQMQDLPRYLDPLLTPMRNAA